MKMAYLWQKRFVVAIDAGTGETMGLSPEEGPRFDLLPQPSWRVFLTDGKGDDRIVYATPGFNLVALNAKTGVPVPTFGANGVVDMMKDLDIDYKGDPNGKIGNSSPVVISNDVIVVGPAHLRPTKTNVKGDVLAYDAKTGKKKWIFHTFPQGRTGYETWLNGRRNTREALASGGRFRGSELGYTNTSTDKRSLWRCSAGRESLFRLFVSISRPR
jgi:quinoprotein glucose dehydrogenase